MSLLLIKQTRVWGMYLQFYCAGRRYIVWQAWQAASWGSGLLPPPPPTSVRKVHKNTCTRTGAYCNRFPLHIFASLLRSAIVKGIIAWENFSNWCCGQLDSNVYCVITPSHHAGFVFSYRSASHGGQWQSSEADLHENRRPSEVGDFHLLNTVLTKVVSYSGNKFAPEPGWFKNLVCEAYCIMCICSFSTIVRTTPGLGNCILHLWPTHEFCFTSNL